MASHAAQPGHVRVQPDRGDRHGVPRRAHARRRGGVGAWRWRSWPGRSAARPSCSASGSGWSRSAAATWCWPGWPSSSSSGRRSATGRREPVAGLALLAAQTIVLLTLALLLSSVVSPMASGIVAVGLFGATWVAGVVGGDRRGAGQRGRRARRHRLPDPAAHRRPVARGDERLPGPDRARPDGPRPAAASRS